MIKEESNKANHRHSWISCMFLILFLCALDQVVKEMAFRMLKGSPSRVLIPGILKLSYVENRGMAFGMMEGKILLFVFFTALFLLLSLWVFRKMPLTSYYLPVWLILCFMDGGALGNLLDRVLRGFVIDYIYFYLIDFPVFNLADMYVVCACFTFLILLFTRYREEEFDFLRR